MTHSGNTNDFDWVYFDCFNTLIDDFDETGDESGLGTLPDISVTRGFFNNRDEFLASYFKLRAQTKRNSASSETLLDTRLRHTLQDSPSGPSPETIESTLSEMLSHWDAEYRATLRPTPGVGKMLAHWSPRKKLGVISNFFLPHLPAEYLRDFGLDPHFDFILDSAAFGFRKPSPEIFNEALKLAGLDRSESHRVLMVGDRLDLTSSRLKSSACKFSTSTATRREETSMKLQQGFPAFAIGPNLAEILSAARTTKAAPHPIHLVATVARYLVSMER